MSRARGGPFPECGRTKRRPTVSGCGLPFESFSGLAVASNHPDAPHVARTIERLLCGAIVPEPRSLTWIGLLHAPLRQSGQALLRRERRLELFDEATTPTLGRRHSLPGIRVSGDCKVRVGPVGSRKPTDRCRFCRPRSVPFRRPGNTRPFSHRPGRRPAK
jgi:hypothetical protein